ncbi:uncharacterized protein PV09_07006 [Verruconis gallopava]|uniref:Cation/H+ exchanger transmembrane domain-containing protein n=1 Tax=Verruconis gallopava TaxID=253628 RepID=A0A0D2A408_9PEZI|nr:uncharacterized protein PV09_07006 [Verruconis gallopava]KIW01528.1 hypothetical protein PV09_07006 [Verruconis gallopava]
MASAASTVLRTVTRTVSASSTPSSTTRATPQGGILEHGNPSVYDAKNPIVMFIIQAGIIIIFCRLLHYPLKHIRQPRVIAEVIGGILLGPSVMGRIPNFSNTIFPQSSIPNLNLVANLGLIMFLFLVGLEVDLRYLVQNWRIAASVGIVGMGLPFGLGAAIAKGLYNQFKDEPGTVPISFGVYMLFVGVAMAITAFPVLCRILVELKLLNTPVGIITLSAGVGNDVVGWILLALCVALVNSGAGVTAVYVLLTCLGWILFMVFAVRPAFIWLLRKTHSIENGPSQGIIALTLLIMLASAFFTQVIGVHAIFGAFLAGIICPHEGAFAIRVAEKIEDLVGAIFLPLYFALSGLSTNLGLLNDGTVWGYVIAIVVVAFSTKFLGAAIAARLNGLVWRESFTIGALMSCKGLVELIVLNIGLQAKILSQRTFTMFVVMALVTTFATTPLTAALYPPWYQKKLAAWKRGEIDWDTGRPLSEDDNSAGDSLAYEKMEKNKIHKMLVYLRLDSMPPLMAFMTTLGGNTPAAAPKLHPKHAKSQVGERSNESSAALVKPIEAYGVRLLELSDRDSSVMQVSEMEAFDHLDPLVNTFRTVGTMHNFAVAGEVAILPDRRFADALVTKAQSVNADFMLIPWTETGSMNEAQPISSENLKNKLESSNYISFVQEALDQATCNTAVFVNRDFGGTASHRAGRPGIYRTKSVQSISSAKYDDVLAPIKDRSHHIFCPFFGGADDRYALRLVLQLAENPEVTASIVFFETDESYFHVDPSVEAMASMTSSRSLGNKADASAARTRSPPGEHDATFFLSLKNSIPATLAGRVVFDTVRTGSAPLKAALARAAEEVGQSPRNAGDLVVCGRNASHLDSFAKETARDAGDAKKCLGAVGIELANSAFKSSVIVVQASANGTD